MADNNNTITMDSNVYQSIIGSINSANQSQEQILASIDRSLRDLVRHDSPFPSQSAFKDQTYEYNHRSRRDSRGRAWNSNEYDDDVDFGIDPQRARRVGQSLNKQIDDFTEELEKQIWQSIAGDPVKKILSESVANFASEIGISVEDMGKELGKKLGEEVGEAIKRSEFGQELSDEFRRAKDKLTNGVTGGLKEVSKVWKDGSFTDIAKAFGEGSGIGEVLKTVKTAFASGGLTGGVSAIANMGLAAIQANPAIATLTATTLVAGIAIDKLSEAVTPAVEGFKQFFEAIGNAMNRNQAYEKERLKNEKERLKKDIESMLEAPFKILEDAANEAYSVWEAMLQTVNQTQGYDKADFQDLWKNYAERLKSEGLDSVVSSADIMTNLGNVLKAGMSGAIAEEFAYIATVLNNAIPTEEFFNYASTYASIAANAVKDGKSQSEAIQEANEQLEQFASNLLYSSRQLAGGFTTGLQNAETLFDAASKISVAAHTNNTAEISGVLTAVSAIVGGIAPDLTSSIVQKITDAATGGNSSELVALRSLAGTGASNTAFLQAMAKDPKAVFTEMFTNLAQMQNMYGDNYMEVAEGLASTFGMSMDEMSRIDFGYLAQAVSAMDMNSASLQENLALLGSGETVYSADQLRMQQINKYMIDEGLSYVLDNEVARAIQEHMWEEQLANEIMENTYSTEMTGATLELFQGIQFTLENLFTMLNPFGWMRKVEALTATVAESAAMNADIKALLEAGKVGNGNAETLYNLTTRGTNLHLTKSYLELLGGHSAYSLISSTHETLRGLQTGKLAGDALKKIVSTSILGSRKAAASSASSQYSWSTIGKSITRDLFTTGNRALYNSGSAYPELNMSAQEAITTASAKKMQDYLDTMQSFVDEGKTYEEWKESAADYGIEDLGAALEDYGLSEVQAKGKFQEMEAVKAAMYEHERDLKEEQFWDDMIKWCEEDFPAYQEQIYIYNDDIILREDQLITNTDLMIGELQAANKQLKEFYKQWVDYFVNHTAYHRDTLGAHEIEAIKTAEQGETGDAVFALAQALTDNMVNLQDPQVQTNALLSEILLVTEAILQIENNTTTVSLPTAMSSLGLGITSVENQY